MWELDYKESWVLKNWCFWTVVLEKTLESPLDCKEIQPVYPKGNQSWIFIGKTGAEAETPILWPPDAKSWLIGRTLMLGKIEGRRRTGWQRMRPTQWAWVWASFWSWWWTGKPGCYSSWGCKESDMTEWLNWTENKFGKDSVGNIWKCHTFPGALTFVTYREERTLADCYN